MSVELTDDQYLDLLLRGRKQKQSGGWFWALFAVGLLFLMTVLTLDHFGLISPALVDKLVGTPQTTFSAQPQGGGGPAQQQPERAPAQQPLTSGGAAPWPTLTPEARPTLTAPAEPYTTKANLGPSSPQSNPGFSCGVEPGMPADATCDDTKPAPEADPEDAPPANIYSVDDRVFQPEVLPTSSVKDNPGFDSSSEPGSEPTPVQ